MYRPEIDRTQRDRCYTCRGTGVSALLTTSLDLQPYQVRMLDMMLSLPEGVKWRLMIGRGCFSGSYGEKDGKLTHRWDGKQWVSLPNVTTHTPGANEKPLK